MNKKRILIGLSIFFLLFFFPNANAYLITINEPQNTTYTDVAPLNISVSEVSNLTIYFNDNFEIVNNTDNYFTYVYGNEVINMSVYSENENGTDFKSIIFTLQNGGHSVNVSSCGSLATSNEIYYLNQSIYNHSGDCISIDGHNITFDCMGNTIDGVDSDYGIYVYNRTNITIKNCYLSDWNRGIFFRIRHCQGRVINITSTSSVTGIFIECNASVENSTFSTNQHGIIYEDYGIGKVKNSIFQSNTNYGGISLSGGNADIQNCTFLSNSNGVKISGISVGTVHNSTFKNNGKGIYIYDASNSTIYNNVFEGNTYDAYLKQQYKQVKNNTFYNNLFNSSNNVYITGSVGINYWNTTKQTGTRIYSNGTKIGGNYWTNSTGNGYSDTCEDSDKDGFCDNSYTIDANNIDYLPLSDEYTPPITIISPQNTTYNYTEIPLEVVNHTEIDKWWYSLNGGSNTTFTPNTTILAPYGSNHLVVYANDTGGNEFSDEVYFFKSNYIDRCTKLIDDNIVYYITKDINYTGICFSINKNYGDKMIKNFTIDCQGHTMRGGDDFFFYYYYDGTYAIKAKIQNCKIKDTNGTRGSITLYHVEQITINNVNFENNSKDIYLIEKVKHITIANSTSKNSQTSIYFVDLNEYATINNFTIENCNYGVHSRYGNAYTTINNSTIKNCTYGVYSSYSGAYASYRLHVRNSVIEDCSYGLYYTYTYGSTSYNNLFNNTVNAYIVPYSTGNKWYTTKQTGTRIYSNGTKIGGNYWTNSTGNGHSDTCEDFNNDGFCDSPYEIASGEVDLYPYSKLYLPEPYSPKYKDPSVNSTYAGQPAEFRVLWGDNENLTQYIFSTNNSGTWKNYTASFTDNPQNATYTITLNSTPYTVVKWKFYAEDGSDNWNSTQEYSLTTQPTYFNLILENYTAIEFGSVSHSSFDNPSAMNGYYKITVNSTCEGKISFSNITLSSNAETMANITMSYSVNSDTEGSRYTLPLNITGLSNNDYVRTWYYLSVPAWQKAGYYAGVQVITGECA